MESGLRWAKLAFRQKVKDDKALFVVPYELKLGIKTKWIIQKGIFTKEEILSMGNLMN